MESNVIEKTISVTGVDITGEIPMGVDESSQEVQVLAGREMYKGDKGASAYEVAVENGFKGTEEEWLESLKASDVHYMHNQGTASDTWVVKHNLGKNPAVTVVDSAGTEVIGDVMHNDINTVTLTFTAAFSGKAYFN